MIKNRYLTIDGVEIQIVNDEAYDRMKDRQPKPVCLEINRYAYAVISLMQWEDIFKLTGLDWNKTDSAYPQTIADAVFIDRIRRGDHPFWYYGDEDGYESCKMFGRPLWRSHIYYKLAIRIECEMMMDWFNKPNPYFTKIVNEK